MGKYMYNAGTAKMSEALILFMRVYETLRWLVKLLYITFYAIHSHNRLNGSLQLARQILCWKAVSV